MSFGRQRLVFLVANLLVASGCGGVLFVETQASCETSAQCGIGSVCDTAQGVCVESPGACSVAFPEGDCPLGTICLNAMCVCADPELCSCGDICPAPWCECTAEQDCDGGVCVDVTEGVNSCAPQRPNGACAGERSCCESGSLCCPSGELCVGNHCVPSEPPCSPDNLLGFCGEGLVCFQGSCVPQDVCACSPENTGGCCPPGQRCIGGGCTNTPCAIGVLGVCDRDEVCNTSTGQCEALPCSPDHKGGSCPGAQFCSSAGGCLDVGECVATVDCEDEEYCSESDECLAEGSCATDNDCEVTLADQFGQGYTCVAPSCIERTNCAEDNDCRPGKFCGELGHCLAPPNCEGDTDCDASKFCSVNNTCILDGTCAEDGDCDGTDFCASNATCLPPGECAGDVDCAPGRTCDAGVCEVTGTPCTSNDFTTDCAGEELSCCNGTGCCTEGQRCGSQGNDASRACIPQAQCVDNSDCLTGYFSCEDYYCVPTKSCDECTASEHCTSITVGSTELQGCVPNNKCVVASDCLAGERCNAEFECVADETCGNEFLSVGSIVEPNVLIVLDRSASMNICGEGDPNAGACGQSAPPTGFCTTTADCPSGDVCDNPDNIPDNGLCWDPCTYGATPADDTPRWTQAYNAIDQITGTTTGGFGTRVRFGLALYPAPNVDQDCNELAAGSDSCGVECRYTTCTGTLTNCAGTLQVPVRDTSGTTAAASTYTDIMDALDPSVTAPGGGTPTAPTLRTILSTPNVASLNDPSRNNAVLLVTDGEAIGDLTTPNPKVCQQDCTGLCGGMCPGCPDGDACTSNDDCDSRVCRDGTCRAESCANEILDAATETAIDCGADCGACADSSACAVGADCQSGVCTSSVCQKPICTDGIKNGSETGVDCGGPCGTCAVGQGCDEDTDCTTGVCQANVCRAASCDNATTDVGESDLDCGGACGPCVDGETCTGNADCQSGTCNGTICETPSCQDGVKNNDETDIDCGGSCAPCGGGKLCSSDSDCDGTCEDCVTYDPDGSDPDSDPDPVSVSNACRVNAAISQLFSLSPRVKTFVVGFAFATPSTNLNCHAVYGRTARADVPLDAGDPSGPSCADLTTDTCDEATARCYYEATDQNSLTTVFNDILDQVSSCTYELAQRPRFGIQFYLRDGTSLERLNRGAQWAFGQTTRQVQFLGSTCDRIRAGAEPVAVYACDVQPGG